jgi:DUF1365 family protein
MRRSALYAGDLVHVRRDAAARRRFAYPVFMAAIDLDELPALDRELRLFSHGGKNLYALHDRDYEGGAAGLAIAHAQLLAAHGIAAPSHVRLVTNLRIAGYVFNPVSFFLGYDAAGVLASVVAEVNNTYGGRHRYVLGPAQRIGTSRGKVGFRAPRELYVSPFLHGERSYEFWFDAALDSAALAVTMHVDTPGGDRVLTAHLAGTRRALTDGALLAAALRFPLMTLQVIGLIHLEALKLRFLEGVPYRRPGPDHRPLAEDVTPTS